MLLTFLTVIALVLITSCSFMMNQVPTKQLPNLADVDLGGDYEIQHINGYPEPTLLHIKTNNTYIVSTKLRTYESFRWHHYWHIAKDGQLLGSFATDKIHDFSFAGVYFNTTSYNDWPLTGDKRDKSYKKIIKGLDIDEKKINDIFLGSDQILWQEVSSYINNESRLEFHFYLKKDDQWSLFISEKKLFNKPNLAWPLMSHIRFNSTQHNNLYDRKLLEKKETESLYPVSSLDWTSVRFSPKKDAVDFITYKKFYSDYRVRNSFMSQTGWEGKVGKGHLQLSLNSKISDFKTYTRELPRFHDKEYDPDMGFYNAAGLDPLASFLLLQLKTNGSGNDRDDAEAGIYVIRKRTFKSSNIQSFVTKLQFNAFNTTPVTRWIIDAHGYRKDWPENFSMKDINLPSSLNPFPTYVDFYFKVPKSIADHSKIDLIINDRFWSWKKSDDIYATIFIDPDEMAYAIKEIAHTNLTLSITMKEEDNAIRLVVKLESSEKSIHLNEVKLVSKAGRDKK